MVKSIQELFLKIERREQERLKKGKEICGTHANLLSAFSTINDQSSFVYSSFVSSEKSFCNGFLRGLLCSHYITKDEFEVLENELSSAYRAYLDRTTKEICTSETGATV